MEDITVGLRAPYDAPGGAAALARFAAQVEATGIDRVCVGDHVTFNGGRGSDGQELRHIGAAISEAQR